MEGKKRIAVENVKPQVDCGRFPVKRLVGERLDVEADIFADGHDSIAAFLMYRKPGSNTWEKVPMKQIGNDRWRASFSAGEIGLWFYTICGGIDRFRTWQQTVRKKLADGQDVSVELGTGIRIVEETCSMAEHDDFVAFRRWCETLVSWDGSAGVEKIALDDEFANIVGKYMTEDGMSFYDIKLPLRVDRERTGFGSWYEVFPRSWGEKGRHGTLKDLETHLPEIAGMGFDVLYLPPIHPIGRTNRKGRNNSITSGADSPGSPWAIGSEEGGHKAIHPMLGSMDDFMSLMDKARQWGMEIALDLAFQCSPDHPYIREHPEWFKWRADETVQYAENPPKRYEDIVPFDFECDDWMNLWKELKSIVLYWIDKGVRIFRVDNPHTKPFVFWEWLLDSILRDQPDTIFLSEAFTRPRVMERLAKIGFSQSYTYFTWRNTKRELQDYMTELTAGPAREYLRPNFWPNTPDILPGILQFGGKAAFISRLVLASTLSSNYGIYGPAFELCLSDSLEGGEEYADSEKYEIKEWNLRSALDFKVLLSRINRIRRENPALRETFNLRFYEVDNGNIIFFEKRTEDLSNLIMVAVDLDPFRRQSGTVHVPIESLGLSPGEPYLLHDLVGDEKCLWHGEYNRIDIDPAVLPVRIFLVQRGLYGEKDFDYFM